MTNVPDSNTLTESGMDLAQSAQGKVLLLACGALAREILAIKDQAGLSHVDLTCLPAKYHNRPELIADGVEAAVLKHRENYEKIFVVYADCGTGGHLEARCEKLGVEMMTGPHCYAFFDGQEVFAKNSEDEITCFYLTDFIARQFDTLIWKGLKLDKHPELKDMFFGNYTKVVYMAQVEDPMLVERAKAAADKLGLEFEMRLTGYGELADFVKMAGSA